MSETQNSEWKAEILLLVTVLIWGLNFGISKWALVRVPPLVFNAVRFTLSLSVLAILFFRMSSWKQEWTEFVRHPVRLIAMGLLGHFVYQFGFIQGLFYTTSGNAALILASTPLWTAISGRLTKTEQLNSAGWLGLLTSLVGTVLIVLGGERSIDFSSDTLLGNALVLGGSVAWGTYTMGSRSFLGTYSPVGFAFFTLLAAVPFLWIVAIPVLGNWSEPLGNYLDWGAMLYSGVLSVGLAYIIWNVAIKQVGSSHTAIYSNLVPIVALVNGLILLGEPIFLSQIVGGSLVLGGLILMRRGRRIARATTMLN